MTSRQHPRKNAPNPTQAEIAEADITIKRHFGRARAQAALEERALPLLGKEGDRLRRMAIIIGTRPDLKSPLDAFVDFLLKIFRRRRA